QRSEIMAPHLVDTRLVPSRYLFFAPGRRSHHHGAAVVPAFNAKSGAKYRHDLVGFFQEGERGVSAHANALARTQGAWGPHRISSTRAGRREKVDLGPAEKAILSDGSGVIFRRHGGE